MLYQWRVLPGCFCGFGWLRFRDEETRFNAAPARLSFPARDRRLCCSGLSSVCPGHCRCGRPARRARRPCQSGKRSTPGQPIWPAPCRLHQAGSPAAARQMASGRGGHPDRRQQTLALAGGRRGRTGRYQAGQISNSVTSTSTRNDHVPSSAANLK